MVHNDDTEERVREVITNTLNELLLIGMGNDQAIRMLLTQAAIRTPSGCIRETLGDLLPAE